MQHYLLLDDKPDFLAKINIFSSIFNFLIYCYITTTDFSVIYFGVGYVINQHKLLKK